MVRLKNNPSQAIVQVLCGKVSNCETTVPFATLRPMTEHDAELCGRTTELEVKARELARWKSEQMAASAKEIQQGC